MSNKVVWPPRIVQLPDWDNAAGVAVICGGADHRVIRRGDEIIALDHPDVEPDLAGVRRAVATGNIRLLGFRFVDTHFIEEEIHRGRTGRTWISAKPNTAGVEIGETPDADGIAPCVRLILERFAPCTWCGRLLSKGTNCTADDNPLCVLANGTGWRRSIPAGWMQATLAGVPNGLSRSWPRRYEWSRNAPMNHVRAAFLASPWWPELHPRRFKNLICQHHADHGGRFADAINAVTHVLEESMGEMRPPPPRE